MKKINIPRLKKLAQKVLEDSESEKPNKPQFAFAIITTDKQGQTIQIFKTRKQAEEFYDALIIKNKK